MQRNAGFFLLLLEYLASGSPYSLCFRPAVVLEPRGREIAEVSRFRHDTLKEFLLLIKVPEKVAEQDACFMEHELHPETVRQIRSLIEALRADTRLYSHLERTIRNQAE